ncbi:MAG TPA: hypothetical protein VMM93_10915 [Vicinamibacterales bacterium]|nr:hypothetical protein [Vicinamibacterales bacterium]
MSQTSSFRVLPALVVPAAAAAVLWAVASPLSAQRTIGGVPSGAALVDFRVLGTSGEPVRDLRADEVKITVDGRDRVVQAVRLVEVSAAAAAAPALPLPYGTNVAPEGQRNVMVLFNDASIRAGQEPDVKAAISRFVATLGPADNVGLLTTPRGSVRLDPTTDRAAFAAALEKVVGQAAPTESADDFTCRTREVLDELRALFTSLSASTSPTYTLFFSAGLAAPTTEGARIGQETSSACELRVDSFQNLSRAAAAGRVQMYVLQPEGLSTPRPGNEGLENLAGVTGSRLYRIGSSGQSVLDTIAAETSAYYLATVALEDVERNGQPHALGITVSRPDTRVLAQNQLVLGSAPAAAGGAASTSTPRDMLRTTAAFRDLPLRVGAYASRNQPGESRLKVIAILEPVESVTLTAASAGLVTGDGRLVAQWTAQPEELKQPMVFAALLAEPGEYRLRMAATDSTGRAGAVDFPVNVTLHTADTVQVSETWTFSTATGQLMPALHYTGDDTAMVLFELYGAPPEDFFAQAELARTADGPALQTPRLQAAQGGEGFLRIVAQFPLAELEAGDYVARFTLGTNPRINLTRTIRKVE